MSQLDNDVFLLSNCWITLLLATRLDLLLARMPSVTVFTNFCRRSAGASIDLVGGGGIHGFSCSGSSGNHCSGQGHHCHRPFSHVVKREGVGLRGETPPLSSLPRPPCASCRALASSHWLGGGGGVIIQGGVVEVKQVQGPLFCGRI